MSAPAANHFHRDHLADLARSGLTEDDARAAGLYSARPGEISGLIGRDVPEGTSALVFPYPGCDGFVRIKPFPPLLDPDGQPLRYLQRAGTGCRLYIPPAVTRVLVDAIHPLAITEGEKKALAVTKAGWPCVGIGGVWNFAVDGELIPDLKVIPWCERIVRLVPDADVWAREDLLPAVYKLTRLLEAKGATVLIVKLPTLAGIGKTGADDFLVAQGARAFRKLIEQAVTVGDPAFRALRQQEKQASKSSATGPLPPELQGRSLHPALHLSDCFASVGIVAHGPQGEAWKLISSERRAYDGEAILPTLMTRPLLYRDLLDRWHPDHVEKFLAGKDDRPRFADAVARIIDIMDSTLELGGDSELSMLTAWTVATYFHSAFLAFPRLDLRGEKGSGKSKTLGVLAGLSFNGLLRVSPTPAVVFRLAEALRPTLCLDEIEGLAGDDRHEILAILNVGYKAGGRVDRCEGDEHSIRSFSVFCPVALAGIAGLNRVTEDRAITLVLTRGTDSKKLNTDIDPTDPCFAEVRDICYRLALLCASEIKSAYASLDLPTWLVGRERELWLPLLTVAHLADAEESLGLTDDLLVLAKAQTGERTGLSDEAEALLAVLQARLNVSGEIMVSPKDITDEVGRALAWEKPPRPETVGRWLKRLKFLKAPRGAEGVRYVVTSEQISGLRSRWRGIGGEPALPTNLHYVTD